MAIVAQALGRERLMRNGCPRQEWVTDLKFFAWVVLHGLRVRVVVFLFCFFLRLCGSGDEAFGNGMVRSYGRLLGGCFVLCLACVPSGWGPRQFWGCACARRCAWFFFCVWPAPPQVGASASLCVCSVVLSFAPRLFQLFRLLPTLSGSSLPCSGMVERACLVARALVLTNDGSSAPATGLLGVGSQPKRR